MDIHQARTKAIQEEIIAKMDAHQERMEASMNAWKKETMACQEAMEACLEKAKAKPEKMKAGMGEMEAAVVVFKERLGRMDATDLEASQEKSDALAEYQDVPKEEIAVETVRALENRYGDRHLAVECCQKPKKWIQGDGGSQKKLAAVCRWMTHHAGTTWRKRHGHKEPTVDKRQWKGPECKNGIRNPGLKQQIRLGNKKTLNKRNVNKAPRQTIVLEAVKLAAGSSTWIRKMGVKASWRSQPQPKCKNRLMRHRFRSTDYSRNFFPHQPEEDDGGTLGLACILSGSRSGRAALGREQQEQLVSELVKRTAAVQSL
jgi:hypothetical protein